jgi:cobalt/nickel transport system permease protein
MSLAFHEHPVRPSPLSRWDACWKLAALLLLGFAFALLQRVETCLAALAIAAWLLVLGRVSPRCIALRAGLILLAVSPALVLLPVTSENGTALATTLGLRALAIGGLGLVLLRSGAVARTFAASARLGLPSTLVQVAQLAHRYAALFQREFNYLQAALRLRGFNPRTDMHTLRTTGQAMGTLFVKGIDRSESVAEAMRARGFDGTYHTLEPFRTTGADVLGFVVMAGAGVALVIWDRTNWFPLEFRLEAVLVL